ncbi:MAG: DinB family protein [Acidobacteriota bacterium]
MSTVSTPVADPTVAALLAEIQVTTDFFNRSTDCLTEEHSGFAPSPELMTVAQQVAHVARTYDWFVEALRPEGFDLDFEKLEVGVKTATSLNEARAWLERANQQAKDAFGSRTAEELAQPLPEGPVMGGQPRTALVGALVDHTAHHRGVLTVYSRLQGLTPKMPYGDM